MKRFAIVVALAFGMAASGVNLTWGSPTRSEWDSPPAENSGDDDSPGHDITAPPTQAPTASNLLATRDARDDEGTTLVRNARHHLWESVVRSGLLLRMWLRLF
jgi:hypothetical protein